MTSVSSRRRACARLLRTLLCAVLSVQLALPSPALAMRPAAPTQSSGLEELERSLRPGAPQPRRQFLSQLTKQLTVFGVAAFLGACDRRPRAPLPAAPPAPMPPVPPAPVPPPIPQAAVDQLLGRLDSLAQIGGNVDAVDRIIRLVFGTDEPAPWRMVNRLPLEIRARERQALARRLLEERLTPARSWELVAGAIARNEANSDAKLAAARIHQFINDLNNQSYDGMYDVWRGRTVVVPHELVIAILLKETEGFHARAMVRRDGRGLMQINRTTLVDEKFWPLLQRHGLVTETFDRKMSDATVNRLLFDPTTNIQVGVLFLRDLLARLVVRVPDPRERIKFALMAYNTGPTYTFGLNNPQDGDELLGGVLKLAGQYQVPLVFEEVLRRSLPVRVGPGRVRQVPLYRVPIIYRDERNLRRQRRLPDSQYRIGVDYTRTGWATLQVLLHLTHPMAPQAGLEEPGRGISRRGFLTTAGAAAMALGIAPRLMAQPAPPAPPPQDGDRNRFILGRHAFVVHPGGIARDDLVEFKTSYSEVYAPLPGVAALRMHGGVLYALMASSREIRLFDNLTTGDAAQDRDRYGPKGAPSYLKPLGVIRPPLGEPGSRRYRDVVFSGATAYVTSVASLDLPAGAQRTWRLEAYSVRNPVQPVLLWQRNLAPPGTPLSGPAVGALAMLGEDHLAVALGDRQGVALYRADRPAPPVATLPLTDVATMIARGSRLYVGQTGGTQDLARVMVWDLETPTAPQRVSETILQGTRALHDLAAGEAPQDPFLYVAVDHQLLIYETQGPRVMLRGQWTFEGEAAQINVRDGIAYVVERFADETRQLHLLSVVSPEEPALTATQNLWSYRVLLTSPDGQTIVYEDRRHGEISPYFLYQQRAGSSYGLLPFKDPLPELIPQFQDNRTVTFLAVGRAATAFFLFTRKPDGMFYEIVPLWDRAGHRWTVFDRDAAGRPLAIIHHAFVPGLTAKNPRSVEITYSLLDPATGRARPEQTTVLLTFDPPRGGLEERGPGISRRGFLTTALGVALGLPIAAESLVTQPLHAQAPPTEAPLFEKPRRFLEEEAHALSPEQTERWLREAVARAPAGPIRAATETMATRLKTEGIRVYLVPGLDQWRQFNRTFRRTGEQNSAFTIHSDATGRVVIAGYAPLFGAGIILHEGIHALAFLKVWRPIIEAVAAGRTPSSEWQAQRNRLNEREGRAQAVYDGIWDRSGVEDPKRVFEQRRTNIGKWAWDLLLELAGADLADLEQAPTHLRQRWIPWQGEFLANLYEMSVYPGWQHQANVAAPVRPRFVARADGGPLTADERAYFLEVVESQPPRGAPFVEAMRDLAERLREPAVSDREAPRLRQWLTRFYVEVLNLPDPWAAVRRGGLEERVMAQLAEAAQGPGVVARQRLENSQTAGPRATGQGGLSGRAAGGGGGTGQSTPPPRPMPESPATSEWLRMPDPSQSPLGNNHTLSQKSAASPTTAPPLTIPGIGWTNNPVASERGSNSLNTSIAARATNSRRFSVRNGLSTGASVSYPIGGINQPTLQALARPQGGPSILRPRSGSNPERQSKGSTRPSASPASSAVEGLRTGLEELRITAGRVWLGPSERVVGRVRAIYDAEGALVGRAVFPDRRRVRLVSAWNEAIERGEFPEWRQPPAPPNRRLGQTGFSLDAWKARTARPPAALGGAQRVLLTNNLQSNFYHPWGFLIADGRVVRQRYAETDYPLDEAGLRQQGDDDALWAFVLEPGPPRIVAVRFKGRAVAEVLTAAVDGGRPVVSAPESKTSLGHVISGVPLILQGHDVSGAVRSKWQGSVPPQAGGLWPNEVNWDPKTTHAAFSAIGTMADGELCLLTVTKPLLIAAFARLGRRLRATNLLLLGGSADVQQEVEGEPPLIAPARADSPRAGERGCPLNAVLVGYELPAAGLEEPPWPADTGRARGVEEFSAYGVSGSALKILQDPHASFFERALALASHLDLDETELGRMVDIDSETIRGWGRGRRDPSPRFVKAISDVLHASPIFLLTSQSEREAFRTRRVEERIALARTAAGFSKQELRQRIIQRRNGVPGVPGEGMGTSTLSDIELGYYTPQHRTCIDIGRVTGVAPALLETGFAPSPLGLFTPTHPHDRTQHGFKTGLSRWERQLVPQLAAALRATWAQDPSSPTALTEPQSVQLAHSMIAALPGALDQAEHYGLLSPSVAQWLRDVPRPSRDGGGRFRWDARYERRHQEWLLNGQQLGRVRELARDLAENYRDLRPLFGNPWEFLTHLVNRARWLAFLNEFAFDRRRLIDAFTERMRSPEAFVAEKERRYQRACSRYLALSNHVIEDIVWMDDDADPRMEEAQTLSVFAQRRWVLSPSHFTDSAEGADSLVRNVAMGPYQALEDAVSAMERRDAAIRNVLATDSQPVSQLLTRVTPLAPVLAPLDQRRADEPGDPNVWAARDLLHRVIAWAQFENPAFLAGTTVEAGHLERPLTRIVQALGKAEAVGLPQGPAALDAFLRGIAHDLVTSGLEERLAQLAEAAQGPGVVEPQSLAGGQMVWPRAAGQEGLSGRDVPGVGSGTGPQSAGLPRTHTPAELSAESTTWAQSPLSGAIAHARRTHPPIAATNPTRNSGGSFPKKSPATPPANRILAKSAEILDNVDRRPSDSTDRPITSSLSSPDGRVNLAPLTLAPPQGGLEEPAGKAVDLFAVRDDTGRRLAAPRLLTWQLGPGQPTPLRTEYGLGAGVPTEIERNAITVEEGKTGHGDEASGAQAVQAICGSCVFLIVYDARTKSMRYAHSNFDDVSNLERELEAVAQRPAGEHQGLTVYLGGRGRTAYQRERPRDHREAEIVQEILEMRARLTRLAEQTGAQVVLAFPEHVGVGVYTLFDRRSGQLFVQELFFDLMDHLSVRNDRKPTLADYLSWLQGSASPRPRPSQGGLEEPVSQAIARSGAMEHQIVASTELPTPKPANTTARGTIDTGWLRHPAQLKALPVILNILARQRPEAPIEIASIGSGYLEPFEIAGTARRWAMRHWWAGTPDVHITAIEPHEFSFEELHQALEGGWIPEAPFQFQPSWLLDLNRSSPLAAEIDAVHKRLEDLAPGEGQARVIFFNNVGYQVNGAAMLRFFQTLSPGTVVLMPPWDDDLPVLLHEVTTRGDPLKGFLKAFDVYTLPRQGGYLLVRRPQGGLENGWRERAAARMRQAVEWVFGSGRFEKTLRRAHAEAQIPRQPTAVLQPNPGVNPELRLGTPADRINWSELPIGATVQAVVGPEGYPYHYTIQKMNAVTLRIWIAKPFVAPAHAVQVPIVRFLSHNSRVTFSGGHLGIPYFYNDGRVGNTWSIDTVTSLELFETPEALDAARRLAVLAETAQGPGVVVIEADVLDQRPELAGWLTRVPEPLAERMLIYGKPAAPERFVARGILVETGGEGELAGVLMAKLQADRVTVVGEEATATTLRGLLPASMTVYHLDPTAGLEELLRAVGVPDAVLEQLDLRIFEGTRALREAA